MARNFISTTIITPTPPSTTTAAAEQDDSSWSQQLYFSDASSHASTPSSEAPQPSCSDMPPIPQCPPTNLPAQPYLLVPNLHVPDPSVREVELGTHPWIVATIIEDDDLMFGGKPLSAWYEEERSRQKNGSGDEEEEEEERRGRQRERPRAHHDVQVYRHHKSNRASHHHSHQIGKDAK